MRDILSSVQGLFVGKFALRCLVSVIALVLLLGIARNPALHKRDYELVKNSHLVSVGLGRREEFACGKYIVWRKCGTGAFGYAFAMFLTGYVISRTSRIRLSRSRREVYFPLGFSAHARLKSSRLDVKDVEESLFTATLRSVQPATFGKPNGSRLKTDCLSPKDSFKIHLVFMHVTQSFDCLQRLHERRVDVFIRSRPSDGSFISPTRIHFRGKWTRTGLGILRAFAFWGGGIDRQGSNLYFVVYSYSKLSTLRWQTFDERDMGGGHEARKGNDLLGVLKRMINGAAFV
ncbi:hypothetical protein EV127DRAFT_411125 [Xylaria flabelliformis]|nr:hypothetical protein EV127DRAFT_411125 [Xylaria flabelliformis]